MTKITYCIKLSDRTICVDIPLAYNPWSKWPWIPRVDPRPDTWINDERLKPGVAQDLSILSTIASLSDQLSPTLSQSILNSVKQAIEQVELPADVSVGF